MDRRKVYVCKQTNDKEFIDVVCDCHMHNGSLRFLIPPDRGHAIPGEVLRETEDGFTFRSTGYNPGEWTFKELTIRDFKRKYFKLVVGGEEMALTIKTTEDLHEWYRKEFKF
jgi:hypothetical protein